MGVIPLPTVLFDGAFVGDSVLLEAVELGVYLDYVQVIAHCVTSGWLLVRIPPSSRIDPGTVRLVAQRLNHYATPGPHSTSTAY